MIDPRSLTVRVGELVVPAWRRLVSALRQLQILPGVGVLLTRTPDGVIVNLRSAVQGFTGSFPVSLRGTAVEIGDGYVNGDVPQIDGKPIIPTDGKPRPTLPLKEDAFDATGRSWICIQKVVTPDGKPTSLSIVQAAHPFRTTDPLAGRHPIAVLVRKPTETKGFGTIHRIAFFDLQHRFNPGTKKHFFFV